MTVADMVAAARRRLRAAGIAADEADLDARLLAERVLGWTTERFLVDAGATEASDEILGRYEQLVGRRAAREPVAYIVARQEFWGLDFEVSPDVLIPRPETELLVEGGLAAIDVLALKRQPVLVADLCTGSGCVAVAIAHDRANVTIVATDVSAAALAVARRNAVRHAVDDRIRFEACDLYPAHPGDFDLVVANPPYVPERDRATLQPEVRDHEPAIALFAGWDGLDVVRRLVAGAPAQLSPGGLLLFEFGFGQSDAVRRLISETAGLRMVELRRDLQGIPRVAVARKDGADGLPLLQDRQP